MAVDTSSICIDSLGPFDSWVKAYRILATSELAAINTNTPDVQAVLLERLNTACGSLVSQKKVALHNSDEYISNKIEATLASGIPCVGAWMKWELGQDFAKSTLQAFGLGELDKLQEYKKSVKDFQHIYNPKTEMACRIALNAAVMTWQEIVQDTAVEGGTELVHVGPGFGQIICMGLGYHQMRHKMLKIMDAAAEKAIMLHQGLIIPNIIHSLECGNVVTNHAIYMAKLAEQAERYEGM